MYELLVDLGVPKNHLIVKDIEDIVNDAIAQPDLAVDFAKDIQNLLIKSPDLFTATSAVISQLSSQSSGDPIANLIFKAKDISKLMQDEAQGIKFVPDGERIASKIADLQSEYSDMATKLGLEEPPELDDVLDYSEGKITQSELMKKMLPKAGTKERGIIRWKDLPSDPWSDITFYPDVIKRQINDLVSLGLNAAALQKAAIMIGVRVQDEMHKTPSRLAGLLNFLKDSNIKNLMFHTDGDPNLFEGVESGARIAGGYDTGLHFGTPAQALDFVRPDRFTWPAFINVKNPLEMPDTGVWNARKVIDELLNQGKISSNEHSKLIRQYDNDVYKLPSTGTFDIQRQAEKNLEMKHIRGVLEPLGLDGIKYINTAEGARGKAYNIAVIPLYPEQVKSLWGASSVDPASANPLKQEFAKVIRGMVWWEDGKAVIAAIEKPNVSTALHEFFHVQMRYLPEADLTTLGTWAGVANGRMLPNWTREALEKVASAYERYWRDGIAPENATQELIDIFAKIKTWMIEIYKEITSTHLNINISPEVRDVFDRMVSGEQMTGLPEQAGTGGKYLTNQPLSQMTTIPTGMTTTGGASIPPPPPGGNIGGGNIPPTPPSGGQPVWEQRYSQQTIRNIANQIKSTKGMLGQKKLTDIFNSNGVTDIELIQRASKNLTNHLQTGDNAGAAKANKIHFDYASTDNFEEFTKKIFPFVIWPKRALPFFTEALMQHPGIALAIQRYNNMSEEDTKGLPPRYRGMAKAGKLGDWIAEKLFGTKGTTMFNPMDVIMPFSDSMIGMSTDISGAQTPGAAARKVAGNVGLGVYPWFDYGATALGLYGDKPLPNVLRHSGIFQAGTDFLGGAEPGFNVENLWKNPVYAAQEGITGSSSSDWTDSLVKRRLQEMSMEETGKPLQYEKAKPGDVVYQQALYDVLRRKDVQSLMGFVSPMYSQTLPTAEEESVAAMSKLPVASKDTSGNFTTLPGQTLDDAYKEAVKQFYAGREANPAASTYGVPKPPISANDLWSRMVLYRRTTPAKRSSWKKNSDWDGWATQYIYWLQRHNHDATKGDIGTINDVREFLKEQDR